MDRDNRWDRTQKAYDLISVEGEISERSPMQVLEESYREEITDEFIEPTRLSSGHLKAGDGLICFNFRPDRVRQLIRSLVCDGFDSFPRQPIPGLKVVTFTQYEANLPVAVAFPPESLDGLLGQVVSAAGLKQFRTAETEKYPHVTYFMNGGIEQPYPGEDRHLVPSPRVATYDQSPAMSAEILTNDCMDATTEAIQTVDHCVGRLMEATNRMGGTLVITADHGNAEVMEGPDGRPWTAHTTNPVPLILVEGEKRKLPGHGTDVHLRSSGGLADVAPTLLEILGLDKPKTMSGESLIEPGHQGVTTGRMAEALGV